MDININNYLRIDLIDMGLVLVSTLIICIVAGVFFWKPAMAYLDGRKKLIQDQLDNAKNAEAKGEEYKNQYAEQEWKGRVYEVYPRSS